MTQSDDPVLSAYLTVHDCDQASLYYQTAFDAIENMRFEMPDGKIGHLSMTIGNSQLMLADAFPDMGFNAPEKFGGSPAAMHLYVDDCDTTMKKAVKAGGMEIRPAENKFYGDRSGMIECPFGYKWHIATRIETLDKDVMMRRFKAEFS